MKYIYIYIIYENKYEILYMNSTFKDRFFCLLVCKVLFTAVLDNYRYT